MLHAKRVGVAYAATPVDLETNHALYQVKNRSCGGGTILKCIHEIEALADPRIASRFLDGEISAVVIDSAGDFRSQK